MAKFMKRIALVLWVLALCVGMLGMGVSAANDPVSAAIEVNIALSGDLPDTPETFAVELTAEDAACPMPQGSKDGVYTLTLQGGTSGKLPLSFDRMGVFHYTVRQLPGTNADCYRDSGVYHITAYVTGGSESGELYLSVVLTREGSGAKQEKIVFGNRYANPAEITLGATKTMDRKTPKDGAFSFVLKDEKGNVLQTVENAGKRVDFATITYNTAGTYTYTIAEVIGKDSKIVYDKTQYTAVVTVEKDDNGDYQAQVVYKLGDKELKGEPAFANKTKSGTPQTGDQNNLGLWILLLLLSGGALAGILWRGKRKNPETQGKECEDLSPELDNGKE